MDAPQEGQPAPDLPLVDELIVGTVKRIVPYGAYVALDEYGDAEGLLHISEISSRWVRNIRNHVREGQKTVLKVLRVDPRKRHINLSLRRVTERMKRERLLQRKRDIRGRKLFDMAVAQMQLDPGTVTDALERRLQDRFGSLYAGFETAAAEGNAALIDAGIPKDQAAALTEIADARIRIQLKKVSGILDVTCPRPNGVEVLRAAFRKAHNIERPANVDVAISVVGAPRYRIDVQADNYKTAEKTLEHAVHVAVETVETAGGEASFTRT